MSTQHRVAAGIPTGGQFDRLTRPECTIRLAPVSEVERSMEWFSGLGGHRKTVSVADLECLGIVSGPQARLSGGSFNATGLTLVIEPDRPVVIRQLTVEKQTVLDYAENLKAGLTLADVAVTDRTGDGMFWHLDGAHRLTAARLLGLTIGARVWR